MDLKDIEEKINNHEIVASITLLSAYVIIIGLKKVENIFVSYALISSSFCLIIALFTILWHKYRSTYRINIFESLKKTVVEKYSKEIHDALEEFLRPKCMLELYKELIERPDELIALCREEQLNGPKSNEKFMKNYKQVVGQSENALSNSIGSFTKNLLIELQEAHNAAFHKPLDEKNSWIKHSLDIISRKFMHHFFVIGILLFFISILLSLI